MTREEAIKVINNHLEHWKRLVRGKVCDETEGAETISAFEVAIKALSQVSEIEENISKYMKKYPNHVGNIDFWNGFYACRNIVKHLDEDEQEPCTDTVSIRKDVLKTRVGNIVAYNVEWLKNHWQMEMDIVCGVKPCTDAVSRDAVMGLVAREHTEWDDLYIDIVKLPSVTQKSETVTEFADRCRECGKMRKGHWIYDETIENWRCSKCNETPKTMGYVGTADFMAEHFKFCNHCGAKMESEE